MLKFKFLLLHVIGLISLATNVFTNKLSPHFYPAVANCKRTETFSQPITEYWSVTRKGVQLPCGVHAHIDEKCTRSNFGSPYSKQMEIMNARKLPISDHKGHLIAAQFCGPVTWYNLAPQAPRVNQSKFKKFENSIRKWIDEGPTNSADLFVSADYLFENRPVSFTVFIKFNTDGVANHCAKYIILNESLDIELTLPKIPC